MDIDISVAALKFFNEGQLDKGINYTFLVLKPKIKNPSTASDYKPISLCNMVYKLVFQVLANRLKMVLPFIIFKIKALLF